MTQMQRNSQAKLKIHQIIHLTFAASVTKEFVLRVKAIRLKRAAKACKELERAAGNVQCHQHWTEFHHPKVNPTTAELK
jgi:hypothetical protein